MPLAQETPAPPKKTIFLPSVIIILSLILEKLLVAILDLCFKKIMSKGGYFIENTDK